jgi:hypothetical protein
VSTKRQESQYREEVRFGRTNVLLILERCINTRTGTDGFRLLCHQFSPSSLSRLGNCISKCNPFCQKMNYFREVPLLLSSTGDQDRNIRNSAFPLSFGRQSCSVWWSGKNRSVQWRQRMESHMKRSVASCSMSKSNVDNKNLSCAVLVVHRRHCALKSHRHTTSVAQEVGSSTGRTWRGGGKRQEEMEIKQQ